MSKKIILVLALVLLSGVALLWFVGGNEGVEEYRAVAPAPRETDGQFAMLIKNAEARKQAPLAESTPGKLPQELTLKPADVKAIPADTPANQQSYGEAYYRVLATFAKSKSANEARLFADYMDSAEPGTLASIQRSAASHAAAAAELAALAVPASATALHLAVANSFLSLAELLAVMSKVQDEPLLAVQAAQHYPERYLAQIQALANMNDYFTTRKITLTRPTMPLYF